MLQYPSYGGLLVVKVYSEYAETPVIKTVYINQTQDKIYSSGILDKLRFPTITLCLHQ